MTKHQLLSSTAVHAGPVHLVVGDPHTIPGESNRRFDWLGLLILHLQPDVVIVMGDLWDMSSLCSYDHGTKGFEGRRYKADIEVGLDAVRRMLEPTRAAKKKLPRIVFIMGNHENRIVRAVDKDPILEGVIGLEDLKLEKQGFEVIPYLEIIEIDGVCYSHYFTSGVKSMPISGVNPAHALNSKKHQSCIQGHVHTKSSSEHAQANGRKIQSMVVGCFFEHDMDWAGPANAMYWRGVVILRDVVDGMYDEEWVSMNQLQRLYG